MEITLRTPAKINLFLEVLGKRRDGYHSIRSLMQPINLFDTLSIKTNSQGLKIRCPGHPELENPSNLVNKAVKLLEKELGRPLPLSIRLKKKIPVGAGLGGGSSNAAATLTGINQLLGGLVPERRLAVLAARIGSDVPFFLNPVTTLASGRGEILKPWPDFPLYWYVLIYPGFSVSTSWAYGQVKFPLTRIEKSINIKRLKTKGLAGGGTFLFNDLEGVVSPYFPGLAKIKTALQDRGCLQALMSGSGSTMFGLWESEEPAREACSRLKRQGWGKVFLVRGL
ncbi:MAG: 4-(cytidine 5'-diphospho)-2-C-methyl-D-erythritol kinase [Thermodesulfobacteriota bacterium]